MEAGDSPEEHFPAYDFDPQKLNLRVRVTLAADRKSVDPVVERPAPQFGAVWSVTARTGSGITTVNLWHPAGRGRAVGAVRFPV